MRLDEFDFDLPAELIAQHPPARRGASRLLTLDGVTGELADRRFADLPHLLHPGDVLVLNDTRVVKARLFGRKASGGKIEIVLERIVDRNRALVLARASHPPQPGTLLAVAGETQARVLERRGELYLLEFLGPDDVPAVLERHGEVPLPPYIERRPQPEDEERYQTVYARIGGAVAAPTAGLHFDAEMLERLERSGIELAYVTLHVGAATFQPVRTRRIEEHTMHAELYDVPAQTVRAVEQARARGGRVVAVGTTSVRALESAAAGGKLMAGSGETRLFITPGYRFRVVERLLTNFHLPRSTLLMLVAAFAGLDNVLRAYRHAVERRYRFFSYGDAMLIERASQAG
jgi:S-adenosylmethionine:tRNA ribosyltransferase-isomerase